MQHSDVALTFDVSIACPFPTLQNIKTNVLALYEQLIWLCVIVVPLENNSPIISVLTLAVTLQMSWMLKGRNRRGLIFRVINPLARLWRLLLFKTHSKSWLWKPHPSGRWSTITIQPSNIIQPTHLFWGDFFRASGKRTVEVAQVRLNWPRGHEAMEGLNVLVDKVSGRP
jgi:hypothetical protein